MILDMASQDVCGNIQRDNVPIECDNVDDPEYIIKRRDTIVLNHRGRNLYIHLPSDDEHVPLLRWPFSERAINLIAAEERATKYEIIPNFVAKYGSPRFRESFNNYMRKCQYKSGTAEYYADWCFDTYKHRKDLIDFLNKDIHNNRKKPTAQMEDPLQAERVIVTENVTLINEVEDSSAQATILSQVATPMKSVMQEGDWTVKRLMERQAYKETIAWATSASQSSILADFVFPGDFLSGKDSKTGILYNYTFFRGHPTFHVQINGTPFHAGLLIVAWVPGGMKHKVSRDALTLTQCSHVFVDPSVSNTATLEINHVFPEAYFTCRGDEEVVLGHLIIGVYSSLRALGNASSEIDVSLWSSIKDCEVHQLRKNAEFTWPVAQAKFVSTSMPQKYIPHTSDDLCHDVGPEMMTRLSLEPTTSQHDVEDQGCTDNGLDHMKIARNSTTLKITSWSTALPSQSPLMSTPVYPTVVRVTDEDNVATFTPTDLAYISRMFRYWRGSLKYTFKVISAGTHKGRLLISFCASPSKPNFGAALMSNTVVLDLEGKKEVSIVTPYLARRNWMRSDLFMPSTGVASDHSWYCETGWITVHVLNRLVCLTAANQTIDVAISVEAGDDFELAIPADMAFLTAIKSESIKRNAFQRPTAQSKVTEFNHEEGSGPDVNPVMDNSLRNITTGMFNESFAMQSVLKRHQIVFETTQEITQNELGEYYITFPNTPLLSDSNFAIENVSKKKRIFQYRTHLAHYATKFTYWKGSLRYKIFVTSNSQNMMFKIQHVPGAWEKDFLILRSSSHHVHAALGAGSIYGVDLGNLQRQNMIGFEVPSYSQMSVLQTSPGAAPNAFNATGSIVLSLATRDLAAKEPLKVSLTIFQAIGGDFELSLPRPCPILYSPERIERVRPINDLSPIFELTDDQKESKNLNKPDEPDKEIVDPVTKPDEKEELVDITEASGSWLYKDSSSRPQFALNRSEYSNLSIQTMIQTLVKYYRDHVVNQSDVPDNSYFEWEQALDYPTDAKIKIPIAHSHRHKDLYFPFNALDDFQAFLDELLSKWKSYSNESNLVDRLLLALESSVYKLQQQTTDLVVDSSFNVFILYNDGVVSSEEADIALPIQLFTTFLSFSLSSFIIALKVRVKSFLDKLREPDPKRRIRFDNAPAFKNFNYKPYKPARVAKNRWVVGLSEHVDSNIRLVSLNNRITGGLTHPLASLCLTANAIYSYNQFSPYPAVIEFDRDIATNDDFVQWYAEVIAMMGSRYYASTTGNPHGRAMNVRWNSKTTICIDDGSLYYQKFVEAGVDFTHVGKYTVNSAYPNIADYLRRNTVDPEIIVLKKNQNLIPTPRKPTAQMLNPFGDVNTAAKDVSVLAKKLTNVVAKIEETVENAQFHDAVEDPNTGDDDEDTDSLVGRLVKAYLEPLLGEMREALGVNFGIAKTIVTVSRVVTGFYAWYYTNSWVIKACAMVTLISELIGSVTRRIKNFLFRIVNKVLELISDNGSRELNTLPMAQSFVLDYVPVLAAILAVGAIVCGFGSIPGDKETMFIVKGVTEKLKLFNFTCTSVKNIKNVFNEIKATMEGVIDQVMNLCAPSVLKQMGAHQGFVDVEKWALDIEKISECNYVNRATLDNDFRIHVNLLKEQADEYLKMLVTGKIGREASVIRELCRKITEIKMAVDDAWTTLPFRVDPFCICFVGPSGVGKSAVVGRVCNDVLSALGYPKHNRSIAINLIDQFFSEHYAQQPAILLDDMSAFSDVTQYHKFFNLKANCPYPLNMAFKKGVYFKSDFIFITTNVPFPSPNEMAHRPALWRRRDILIDVKFKTRELQERYERGEIIHEYDMSHAEFAFRNPKSATDPGQFPLPLQYMSYDDMLQIIIKKSIDHHRNQQNIVTTGLIAGGHIVPEFPILPTRTAWEEFQFTEGFFEELHAQIPERIIEDVEPVVEPEPWQFIGVQDGWRPNPEWIAQQPHGWRPPPEWRGAVAHAGEITIDESKCSQDFVLCMFCDANLFENLVFVEGACADGTSGAFSLREGDFEDRAQVERTWKCLQDVAVSNKFNIHNRLFSCRKSNTTVSKIRDRVRQFTSFLATSWDKLKSWLADTFPMLANLRKWPIFLAAAIGVIGATVAGTKAISCACAQLTRFGFRCRQCGKWPAMEDVRDKKWMKDEWVKLHGCEPYLDGKITPLTQEQLVGQQSGFDIAEITAGTQILAQGAYNSGDGKHAVVHRIMAQGPYNGGEGKHASGIKIMAHQNDSTDPKEFTTEHRPIAHNGASAIDLINNTIVGHTYRLMITLPSGAKTYVNGFAIGGTWILAPKHFMDLSKGHFHIWHSTNWQKEYVDPVQFFVLAKKDIVAIQLSRRFHEHRDIRKKFISEQALEYHVATSATLVEQEGVIDIRRHATVARQIRDLDYFVQNLEDPKAEPSTMYITGAWFYNAAVKPGSCGSALIAHSERLSGKILGLHIAGVDCEGYATLITCEMLQNLELSSRLGTPLPTTNGVIGRKIPNGHFGQAGDVPRGSGVYPPTKTDIIKTPLYGSCTPAVTAPSVLSNSDPRLEEKKDILVSALEKFGELHDEFEPEHIRMVREHVWAQIEMWELPRVPKLLTEEEMIGGILELPGYEKLPMNTSPGWPYVLTKPSFARGKAYLFDVNTHRMEDPVLREKFEIREKFARYGERVESLWTCCLKDERRSFAKIASGSTRLFMLPPVDFSLLFRKYTLDFTETVKLNRGDSFCKIGIDPQSLEWTKLYHQLAFMSPYCIAGDYSRYDACLNPTIMDDVRILVERFYERFSTSYDEKDALVRKALFNELIHTPLLVRDSVVVKHGGNPSGNPFTTVMNSIVNYYYIALSWLALAPPEYRTMREFRNNTQIATFGDDNLFTVTKEVLEWFNQITISKFLATKGITYTNATKTGLTKYMKLDEATFLKNGFGTHKEFGDLKVPLMAEPTIQELINWTRKAPDQDALVEDNINDSLRFAYFYGEQYFEGWRKKIVNAVRRIGKKYDVMTYFDFHFWFCCVTGKLKAYNNIEAQNMLVTIAHSGNGRVARLFGKVTQGLPYVICKTLGVFAEDETLVKTDTRCAIVIPSGEGKSWLCSHYPYLFADHDDLLLPAVRGLLAQKNFNKDTFKSVFDIDLPPEDKRILLCHHANNTRRRVIGSFLLPTPTYIRVNALQRLRIKNADILPLAKRNEVIFDLIREYEPGLYRHYLSALNRATFVIE